MTPYPKRRRTPAVADRQIRARGNRALRGLGDAKEWGEDTAGAFQQLTQVMRATLSDLSLVFARGKGVVRVRVWLFGRTEDGTLIGLRSISTET